MSRSSLDLKSIGPYRLVEKLGVGAMGTVFLAEEDDELVALKVIHPHLVEREGFFKRFQREAEAGQRVDHPNVVRTLDCDFVWVGETPLCFLVMELVEGATLRDLATEFGTIPEAMLRELATQIAAGLGAIHGEGIVHRDIKPENVLITEEQQVRIMDLGVAKIQDAETLTRAGQFAGSLLYAAPEQIQEGEVGPWSDLYSLGVMIYELGTGVNPFRHDDPAAMIKAHLEVVPPRMNERNSEVSTFLSEVVASLVSKEPAGRFGSAKALVEVLTLGEKSGWWTAREPELLRFRDRRPRISVRRDTVLHGRERELALLESAWSRAREGEGAIVLVEGEAGIGKTRLMDSLVARLENEDAHVLYGSYPPSGGMGGISDAILGKFGMAGLSVAIRPYLRVTPSLAPAFAAVVKHEQAPEGTAVLQRDSLHAVLCHLMRGLAEEKPLLWIVDDLHFAEPDARKGILSLARAAEGHRVMLVVTSRPELVEDDVTHLSRLRRFERLALGRLSPREVVALLRDAFQSRSLADKLAAMIAFKSDGVPFFIFEMIRELKEKEHIKALADGMWVETHEIEDIEVPSAVRDLIQARIGGLAEDDRILLDMAAVQGFEFDADLLAKTCDKKIVEVLQTLARIERSSGVVRGAGPVYRFDHHQIQEVIHADLPPRLRAEYHAQAAEAFAEITGVDADAIDHASGEACWFVATHHLQGSRPRAGLPFLTRALDQLESSYSNESAINLIDLALGSSDVLPPDAQVDLLLRKVDLLSHLGRRGEVLSTLERALEAARGAGDALRKSGKALCRLGEHYVFSARPQEGIEPLEQALELAREAGDRVGEGAVCGRIGTAMFGFGRFESAREWYERHLAIARETGYRHGVAAATGNLGNLWSAQGRFEKAEEHFKRALEIQREEGDRRGEAMSLGNLANICTNAGRPEEARDLYGQYLEISQEIGYRRGECLATGNLGTVFSHTGWYEVGGDQFSRCLTIAREIGDIELSTLALANLGQLHLELGDPAAAGRYCEEARQLSENAGYRQLLGYAVRGQGHIAESAGDRVEAESRYREAIEVWREIQYAPGVGNCLICLGRVLETCGRSEEARGVFEEGLSIGGELDVAGLIVLGGAYLALLGGDREGALREYEARADRLSILERMEARFLHWRLTGDPANLEEAREMFEQLREHAPADRREPMAEGFLLFREILAATAS